MPLLNYKSGLRKLKANVHQKLKLTNDALELLSDLCNDLNSTLVEASKSDFKAHKKNKDDEMTHQNVQNAVKKVFKNRVKDFAVAEGQKAVFMFKNKLLRYNEKKALIQEPRDKKPALRPLVIRPPGSEYGRGLNELLANIHPYVSLSASSKSYLGGVIDDVCWTLISGVGETSRGTSTLKPEDISAVVGALFGPTMYDHADREGMHAVGLYDHGFYQFTPKRRKPVVPQVPPKRRKMSVLHSAVGNLQTSKREIFTTGIKKIATNMHDECQLEKSALKKMNYLLTSVLQRLAISAINNGIQNDLMELTPIALQNAVREILPEALAFYAQAEGERAITLYHERLIPFRPKHVVLRGMETPDDGKPAAKRRKKQSKKAAKTDELSPKDQPPLLKPLKKKKVTNLDFTVALRTLLTEIHELGTFNRSAGDLINRTLTDITKRMIEVAVGKAKDKQELNPQHVQSALKELFPGKMQGLAISEANKAVAIFAEKGKKGRSSSAKAPQTAESAPTAPTPSPEPQPSGVPASVPPAPQEDVPPSHEDQPSPSTESELPASENLEASLNSD